MDPTDPRRKIDADQIAPDTFPTSNDSPQTPTREPQQGRLRALTDSLRGRSPTIRTSWTLTPGGSYSALDERDVSPSAGLGTDHRPGRNTTRLAIPSGNTTGGTQAHSAQHDSPSSPLTDGSGFQAALTGIPDIMFGVTTYSDSSSSRHRPPNIRPPSAHSSLNTFGRDDDEEAPPFASVPLMDVDTPLSDNAAPISGAVSASPNRRSVHFGSNAMLGDDLGAGAGEAGSHRSSASHMRGRSNSGRSLSPLSSSSPISRTGTMLRNMSQRIVNLSNEQDVVQRTIRRRSTAKSSVHDADDIEMASIGQAEASEREDYASADTTPLEKVPSTQSIRPLQRSREFATNPFRGKSLMLFPPDSTLRLKLCDLLLHPWTEPTVFCLIIIQTVLLAIDSNRKVEYDQPAEFRFGNSWIDWCILLLFCIYTVELIIRIIVSGFFVNPLEYSTINRQIGLRRAVRAKAGTLLGTPHTVPKATPDSSTHVVDQQKPSLLRSLTMHGDMIDSRQGDSKYNQRARLAHRAFLRHSFNRLDFVAVCAYWISFIMQLFMFETGRHIFVFRMMSCLRIMRLLYLTSGTTVILRSLKKAAPMLLNVAFLIGFFWLLFAIIGVQSFKSSLRRQCLWMNPQDATDTWINEFQFCGGYLDNVTFAPKPWLKADGVTLGTTVHKGYLCPVQSVCQEVGNPYNGTVNFDNIANSLELIFVIMTSNTFTDLMYYLTESDYLSAALFFAFATVIMFLWLVNLLIAVITSSFQVIREESKASAFTGQEEDNKMDMTDPEEERKLRKSRRSTVKSLFGRTKWFWIAVITLGLVVQAFRTADMSPRHAELISAVESIVTFALLLEIGIRFGVDWRNFYKSKANLVDLALAVITTIIQIPPIHDSGVPYAWLTFFQIVRIYRVVLAVPLTRDLIHIVLGNVSGLLNLILFVWLFVFLAAILAAQMFRGSIPPVDPNTGNTIRVTFFSMWNSFLGMYQIFSSENWTVILYYVTNFDVYYNTAWIGAMFFVLWFILANFITLNMFIAVIQENFDVSEDEKRLQQVKAFLQQREAGTSSGHGNLSLSTIFRYRGISGRRQDPGPYGSNAATELLLKDAVVRDFLDQNEDPTSVQSPGFEADEPRPLLRPAPTAVVRTGTLSSLWTSFVGKIRDEEPNPFYSRLNFNKAGDAELDPTQMAKEVMSAQTRRKQAQREYLRKHPTYNVSLFAFKPENRIRRICQRIVGPGRGGDRIEGVAPSIPVWYTFSAFIYAAIVAMVVLACVTTPLYQKEYFQSHVFSPKNWFVWSDMGFALVFTIEALIKVIADGFFWTPNAYYRSSWGFIDGVVLVTLWINVSAALYNAGEVSRAIGAFKALRALRLLNVSDSARENFHAVIVRGGLKVISAMFVSLSLLVPFAIYGLNLFADKMVSCNDGSNNIVNLNACVGEYNTSNPFNWNILAPRVASNPPYNFDNFGSSLFILFQIVSQEGWVDVMWSAQSITGAFQQPQPFSSQGNAFFFVVFNLLGAVFVLTLFVSVFMRNYTEMTGVAFLTSDQRSWLELRKLLRQVAPSKRPTNTDTQSKLKKRIYRMAVRKTGAWQRVVTGTLICHLILLCIEFYPTMEVWDVTRGKAIAFHVGAELTISDVLFLGCTLIYITNIVVRFIGLTWPRFRKSTWDLYAVVSVSGTFVSTIAIIIFPGSLGLIRVNKLFLVSIALLLIPRNNQLDQLFKTAAASLPLIVNLLATWFVLFLVFAIAMTQAFGLTKFGANESSNINFRDVPKALILLFRMSMGEGWNNIMQDISAMRPPFCVEGTSFNTDCGSATWATVLFVAWNILSMYIFVNLFISLIYESFSYVYQQSSGLAVISREEIRRFKEAWAVIDPDGTGYISQEKLPKLLRELSGVFEMRIYDGDYTVKSMCDDCCTTIRPGSSFSTVTVDQAAPRTIDLKKLNERLDSLPVWEIRRRRQRLNRFYEEVLVSSDRDRGISFSTLLMILAHYKVINDNKSLRLSEFLRRRARLQRVDEAVRRQVVIGFFDTVYWRRYLRRHRTHRQSARMQTVPQFTVPEIFVEDEDDASGGNTADKGAASHVSSPSLSSTHTQSARNSIQISPVPTPPMLTPQHTGDHDIRRSLSERRLDMSMNLGLEPGSPGGLEVGDEGRRGRSNSAVSVQEVLDALDQSAWGASLRRSFSQQRRSPQRRGTDEI